MPVCRASHVARRGRASCTFSPRARIHPVLLPPAPLPRRAQRSTGTSTCRGSTFHNRAPHKGHSLTVWSLVAGAPHGPPRPCACPWPRRSARPSRRWSACAPRRGGVLYVVPRPAHHARRARGGRAAPPRWRAGAPGGGTQRTVLEPVVVHAEATQRAQVALLSACGLSVGYQHGGWNAIIAFWSRPPDLCSCWRIRWPVGPRRPVRHGEVPGVLISILC